MSYKRSHSRTRSLSSESYERGSLRSASTVLPSLPPPRLTSTTLRQHREFFAKRMPSLPPKGSRIEEHLQFAATAMDLVNDCRLLDSAKDTDIFQFREALVVFRQALQSQCFTAARSERIECVLPHATHFEDDESSGEMVRELADVCSTNGSSVLTKDSIKKGAMGENLEDIDNYSDSDDEWATIRREVDNSEDDSESESKSQCIEDSIEQDEKNCDALNVFLVAHRDVWIEAESGRRDDFDWVFWRHWTKQQVFLWLCKALRGALEIDGEEVICWTQCAQSALYKVMTANVSGQKLNALLSSVHRSVVLASVGLDDCGLNGAESQRLWHAFLRLQRMNGPLRAGTPPTEVEFEMPVGDEGGATH